MFFRIISASLIIGLLYWPFTHTDVHGDGPTVIINELMWMGSSVSSADEWLELRNLTDQLIDLSDWQLTKKSSDQEVAMLTIPAGKSIPAQGYFLVSNYSNTSTTSILNVAPDLINTDMALSNSALQIKLYDTGHLLIDTADDGTGNPLAGSYDSTKKIYASMERNSIPGDGSLVQSWHTASRGTGFKEAAVEFGTPGTVNSNALPIAEAGPDATGVVGQEINFDGSDSSDLDGQMLTYVWDFGDSSGASEATPKHAYAAAGAYEVKLTVNDGVDLASDTLKATITAAPAAALPPPAPVVITTPSPLLTQGGDSPTATTTNVQSCKGMVLSEIYPNPPGVDNDEFIELQNTGDDELTIGPCVISLGATKKYAIKDGGTIPAHGYLNMPKSQTKLTLTNTGGEMQLIDADSAMLDQTKYATAPEGKSWAKIDGVWAWTNKVTPGSQNMAGDKDDETTTNTNTNTGASKKTTTNSNTSVSTKSKKSELVPQRVSLADVQSLDSGDKVVVNGTVTSPVGTFGSTIATIQETDGGIVITVPNGEPTIKIGQEIEITGTVRLNQGRRRVAVSAQGLKVLSDPKEVTPIQLATDEVGPERADQLVQIAGVVSVASGSRIEIDDGSGPATIYIKSSTGIVRPKVKMGDKVEVIGVVDVSSSGIRILPRLTDDLRVEKVLGASTTASQPTTLPTNNTKQSWWYWLFVLLGGLALGVKPAWQWWKKRKEMVNQE